MENIIRSYKATDGSYLEIATDDKGMMYQRLVNSSGVASNWISSDYEVNKLNHSTTNSTDYKSPSDRIEAIEALLNKTSSKIVDESSIISATKSNISADTSFVSSILSGDMIESALSNYFKNNPKVLADGIYSSIESMVDTDDTDKSTNNNTNNK